MTDWQRVKHFTRGEFGRHEDIEPDDALVRMLDRARDIAGVPFVINSGIRSPERNAEVGGVDSSAHLTGHAVDIRCASSGHRYIMLDSLLIAGFRRIGISGKSGFIHVDTDQSKPAGVIWTY